MLKEIIIIINVVFILCVAASRLNEYIGRYETLDYDPVEIHQRHLRVKRWAVEGSEYEEEPGVRLAFRAHEKTFKLRLKRDTSVFSRTIHVEGDGSDGPFQPLDDSHIYAGHLEGEEDGWNQLMRI